MVLVHSPPQCPCFYQILSRKTLSPHNSTFQGPGDRTRHGNLGAHSLQQYSGPS